MIDSETEYSDLRRLRRLLAARPQAALEKDERERVPLHRAIESRSEGAVRMLLKAAPDAALVETCVSTELGSDEECLALHVAAAYGSETIVRLVLEAAPAAVRRSSRLGNLPLHFAASFNSAGVVRMLLEAAPDSITAPAELDLRPLHLACRFQKFVAICIWGPTCT